MFVVHFFEDNNLLLSQMLKNIPAEGENLTIKGRKGKVSSINSIDEQKFHVQVHLEKVSKNVPIVENTKKKKR